MEMYSAKFDISVKYQREHREIICINKNPIKPMYAERDSNRLITRHKVELSCNFEPAQSYVVTPQIRFIK